MIAFKKFDNLTDEELKTAKKEYGKNIKQVCFSCGEKIENDLKRYWMLGNCCTDCSVKADKTIKNNIKRNYELHKKSSK